MPGVLERVQLANPLATAGGRIIASPFQFTFSGSENLRIVSANSLPGVTILIQGRLLDAFNAVQPFAFIHTPNSDRSTKVQQFALGACTLLTMTVVASGAAPKRGQTFVQVQVIQGFSGGVTVLGTMLQGYVTSVQHLAWPGSPIEHSFEGQGFNRVVVGSLPALGSSVVESCPTGARWRVVTFIASLVTDATVATRLPFLQLLHGGTIAFRSAVARGCAASETDHCQWLSDSDGNAIGTAGQFFITGPLPQQVLIGGGDILQVDALGLQPGDGWTAPAYQVEEWLEMN